MASKHRVRWLWRIGTVTALVVAGLLLVRVMTSTASDRARTDDQDARATPRPDWLKPLGAQPQTEPKELWPGEPGVLDVQRWHWLELDLEKFVDRTRPKARDRLTADAFQREFVGATVAFLELEGEAATRFERAVDTARDEIEVAREEMLARRSRMEPDLEELEAAQEQSALWREFVNAQQDAVQHLRGTLEARPRNTLLREEALRWLLRLDYGIRNSSR